MALPVVAVVVTLAVAGVLVVDTQGRLDLAAATAARALGRDDPDGSRSVLDRLEPRATSTVTRHDGLVCVAVEVRPVGPFGSIALHGDGCAAEGGR